MKKFLKCFVFAATLLTPGFVYADGEWINMGNYGVGYEHLCRYHRDTYTAMSMQADCLWNGNGVTLWVYYRS
ncbi:MAG: hypothetical protein M3Q07_21280 [Pseudobdellovibrionaceae bacterium]|uniref:hypothetical protein n=1 Tax=Oligoflexus sp. TaxID=1971216 RepID=UPI0027CA5060|nr:hypothetical protein [Oligoflexus sp.]MDQ3234347.1 hypothetical protein [Pseudobdellovibrionaceae bacterium]HYX37728.1 hypothetical protein [Oligoflexus sp.]